MKSLKRAKALNSSSSESRRLGARTSRFLITTLTAIVTFFASMASVNAGFQRLEYTVVITPDHFPIVFPKRNADGDPVDYGQPTQIAASELLNTDICYSSPNCSDEARAAGAVYYKVIDTNGDGVNDVIVYYDELGNLIGTQKISEITTYDASLVSQQDSNQYNHTPNTSASIQDAAIENAFPTDYTGYLVGATKASFEVTPSGAANYRIPLDLPPAINDLVPNLAIRYGGNERNGLLGVGFSLDGLSEISRCSKTKAQDGLPYNRKAVNFSSDDAFCLDGERLFLVTGTHGASGAVYRSEIDRFSRVTITDTDSYGPTGFKVETKDGRKLIYNTNVRLSGSNPNWNPYIDPVSDLVAQSETYKWPITTIENASGQTIDFDYEIQDGFYQEYRPFTVTYGGQGNPTVVTFNYQARSDTMSQYRKGYEFKTTKVLDYITVVHNGSGVRKYDLSYQTDTNELSRVDQIQECGMPLGSPSYTDCLPPITFDWDKKRFTNTFSGETFASYTSDGSSVVKSTIYQTATDTSRIKFGDFNGDGRTDVYHVIGSGSSDSDMIYFSNPDGTSTPVLTSYQTQVRGDDAGKRYDISRIMLGDFNGDGKTDVYLVNSIGGNDTLYFSNGDGTFSSHTITYSVRPKTSTSNESIYIARNKLGDFNGDGMTDIYCVFGWGSTMSDIVYFSNGDGTFNSEPTSFQTTVSDVDNEASIDLSRFKLGDFNGDGKTDIYYINGWGGTPSLDKIYISVGDGSYTEINGLYTIVRNSIVSGFEPDGKGDIARIELGDFNGDGLRDIYQINGIGTLSTRVAKRYNPISGQLEGSVGNQDKIYLSRGDGTYIEQNGLNFNYEGDDSGLTNWIARFRFADFNRDGKTDIYYITGSGGAANDKIYHAKTSGGFDEYETTISTEVQNGTLAETAKDIWRIRYGDFNADGLLDVYRINGSGTSDPDSIHFNQNGLNKVTGIKNGPLAKTVIEYEYLTRGGDALYSLGSEVFTSTERTLITRDTVVEAVSVDNGVGSLNRTTYRYEDLRYNREGRGVQGFRKFEVTDHALKVRTSKTFRRDFPYKGKLEQMTKSVFDSVNADNSLNNGRPIKTIDNDYYAQQFESSQNPGRYRYNPINSLSTTNYYESSINNASSHKTVTENYGPLSNFDADGNPSWLEITTTGAGDTHRKTVSNDYYPPNYPNWIIGKLQNTQVVHHFSGASADLSNTDITREVGFTYDANGRLETETIEPNAADATLKKVTTYGYDPTYGTKSTVTETGTNADGDNLTRVATINRIAEVYDSSHPAIKVTTTNSLNQSETVWTSLRHGGQIAHRGPNGKDTTANYDGLGRKTSETSSLNVTTELSYQWTFSEPLLSVYKITQSTQGLEDDKTTYYDVLDRVVREQSRSIDGRDVVSETVYDENGRKSRISRPYLAHTEPVWICFSYDEVGRQTEKNSPAAMGGSPSCTGGNRATATAEYDAFTTTTTDELGHKRIEKKNILDQFSRIDEAHGTLDHSWLTYTYNALGKLKQVTDANGKNTILGYDNNGRKTSIDDPAMGIWNYVYDSFDQLTKQTDAKLQETHLDYDAVGRMTSRIDGEGSWSWTYGTVNDDATGEKIGKLKAVSGPDGYAKTIEYNTNLLPRKVSETQKVTYESNLTPPGDPMETLIQTFEYDGFGRLLKQTRPDGFEVENEYNPYGHLVAVKSPQTTISTAARAALEDVKADALAKLAEAEAKANSYLSQAYSYQQKAIEYETYAISLLRLNGYEIREDYKTDTGNPILDMANDAVGALYAVPAYNAANELRDISQALISQAESIRGDALREANDAIAAVDLDTASSHRLKAQSFAQQASDKLSKAKQIAAQVRQSGVSDAQTVLQLQSAESMLTGAQTAYRNFQDHTALAERYERYAAGIDADLLNTGATTWWRAAAADAEGRITTTVYGNGTTTERTYDPNNGQLLRILTTDGVQTLQDLNYTYDNLDNVKTRADDVLHYSESFDYDHLDRLTDTTMTVTGVGDASRSWEYDKVGNIEKIDNNVLDYDAAGKITAYVTEGAAYTYDDNGNQTESAGKTITWSSFNKPVTLTRGQTRAEFTYNADHQRMLKVNKESLIITTTTRYFGDYEKIVAANGDIEHRHYITVGGEAVAVRSFKTDAAGVATETPKSNYLHKDALGSVDLITDDAGGSPIRLGYTPYGTRRDMSALQAMTSYSSLSAINFTALVTNRGFTGHEHVDELDLVHMNGRVYDPESGRFLSADPFVFYPFSTQGFNRYAYVFGNPMKYRDPSGFETVCDADGNCVDAPVDQGDGGPHTGWENLEPGVVYHGDDRDYLNMVDPEATNEQNTVLDPRELDGPDSNNADTNHTSPLNGYEGSGEGGTISTGAPSPSVVGGEDQPDFTLDYTDIVGGVVEFMGNAFPGGMFGLIVRSVEDRPMTPEEMQRAAMIAGMSFGAVRHLGFNVASGVGRSAPMQQVREIGKGEKISDLVNEAKALTFTTGNEHAVVTLAGGQRALVSGGPGGISFSNGQVSRVFGHTHPTSAPPSAADVRALSVLGQTKQYVLHGGVVSIVRTPR